MATLKGKAKETLGWLTGDRRVEAEGRVETRDDESSVEAAEREVRREEGELKK